MLFRKRSPNGIIGRSLEASYSLAFFDALRIKISNKEERPAWGRSCFETDKARVAGLRGQRE